MQASVAEVLLALANVFGRQGVPWYVFGAQAVMVHGQPRLSDDVDITIKVDSDRLEDLLSHLKNVDFVEQVVGESRDEFIESTRVVPLVHKPTSIPIDLVLANSGLEDLFLCRALKQNLGGANVPIIAPEHLVVTKILAGRPKDIADAQSVILRQGDSLDIVEVRQLLFDLQNALDQSDLVPALDSLTV